MKELDVVELLKNYENIPEGTEGTIVLDYDKNTCEVEFYDGEGYTIDVVTIPKNLLRIVTHKHSSFN